MSLRFWGRTAWFGLAALTSAYALSSLVVVVNATGNATGTVWLPTFPDAYYRVVRALYGPLWWYEDLLAPLRSSTFIDYATYAWISRAPFLALPFAFVVARLRGNRQPVTRIAECFAGAFAVWFMIIGATLALAVLGGEGMQTRIATAVNAVGAWGPLVLLLLMALQAVPMPFPTIIITVTCGLLYGPWFGGLIAWAGAMVAATVSFGLGRAVGRRLVIRLGGGPALAVIDRWFEVGGFRTVLVLRLSPPMSFRAVSLAAGVTPMRLVPFLVATGLGQVPGTLAYAALGASLVGDVRALVWSGAAIGALIVTGSFVHAISLPTAGARRGVVIASIRRIAGHRAVRPVVGLTLLAVVLWTSGMRTVGEVLVRTDPQWFGLAVLLTLTALAVSAWKWQLVLRMVGPEVPLGSLLTAYLVGLFFNNFLPSNIGGDVARAHIIGRRTGSTSEVAASIVAERLLGGLALVATAAVALAANPELVGIAGSSIAAVGTVFLAFTLASSLPGPREAIIAWLGSTGYRGAVARTLGGLGASFRDGPTVVAVFVLSMIFQAMVVVVAWCAFVAVGVPVPIGTAFALIPVISAAQLVPVSVGGFGVREGAYVFFFGTCCAIAPTDAIASSLIFATVVAVVSVLGGVAYVAGRDRASELGGDQRIAALITRTERETWFDATWLWTFARGMQAGGRSVDQTLAAIERQRTANRLSRHVRVLRRVQLFGRALRRRSDPTSAHA